jgi:4-amino-4-deoxy-L-arabinose transferase-like glycosyltransferase
MDATNSFFIIQKPICLMSSRFLSFLLLCLLVALIFFVNLDSTPPVWWDEGWTLTVARTLSERGSYAMLLNGDPVPAGLQAALPVTGLVALAFRALGVGVWQGRLVGVLFTVALLFAFYKLAEQLYDRRVAITAVLASLLMIMHPQNHPIVMGREVLGEPAMLFDVLVGFLFLKWSLESNAWAIIPTIFFWGLAIVTKAQTLPFLCVALIVPSVFALWFRRC